MSDISISVQVCTLWLWIAVICFDVIWTNHFWIEVICLISRLGVGNRMLGNMIIKITTGSPVNERSK